MRKIYFFLFISLAFLVSAQNYSYLNASTGNESQFFTDKDTNIYMYHDNRLEKINKNFVPIWVKTYSGIKFKSVLLSKTGSMYFTALVVAPYAEIFGKLDANGNLSWLKSLKNMTITVAGTTQAVSNINCRQLTLDYQNNIVLTGLFYTTAQKAFLLKTDTLGSVLKFKMFDSPNIFSSSYNFEAFNLMCDSSGNYKIYSHAYTLPGYILSVHNYSDVEDSINSSAYFNFTYPPGTMNGYVFFKSRFNNSYYICYSGYFSSQNTCFVLKIRNDKTVWNRTVNIGGTSFFGGFDEDEKGNVFITSSTGPSSSIYTAGCARIDSNGYAWYGFKTHFNGYNAGTVFNCPSTKINVIHFNNYYIDVFGGYFPSNPLTIVKVDTTLSTFCSSFSSLGSSPGNGTFFSPNSIPKTRTVSSYTFQNLASSATSVLNFSVNPNFCLVLGQNELISNSSSVILFPNPSQNKIEISSDYFVEEINLFDVSGKNLGNFKNAHEINISYLPQGIYFLKIQTDRGEVNRKLVKE